MHENPDDRRILTFDGPQNSMPLSTCKTIRPWTIVLVPRSLRSDLKMNGLVSYLVSQLKGTMLARIYYRRNTVCRFSIFYVPDVKRRAGPTDGGGWTHRVNLNFEVQASSKMPPARRIENKQPLTKLLILTLTYLYT